MQILFYVLLTVHIASCFFLIAVVLLQQGKGQDLASAFGGGVTQTAFGPRGSANLLSRLTTILAGVFMVTSLSLSVVRPRSTFLEQIPASPAPAAEEVPAALPEPPSAPAQEPAEAPAAPAETN